VRQLMRGQDLCKTWSETSKRLDSFLHEAVQNCKVISNIQERN
jgi:hypothetical protein